jgi:nitroimidazol reductase NimA-like FMN-containing flavoprotein (pyridoxamine 5'-phosphate oxidase superfamily)
VPKSVHRDAALTAAELDGLMTDAKVMRIASIGPGTRINLTPMWFGWAGGCVYTYGRGQKVVNLRREPSVTVLVDRNERFVELTGAMLQGRATVLETAEDEAADPHLEEVRVLMGKKYAGYHPTPATDGQPLASTAAGRTRRWIRVDIDKALTWDNAKLFGGR